MHAKSLSCDYYLPNLQKIYANKFCSISLHDAENSVIPFHLHPWKKVMFYTKIVTCKVDLNFFHSWNRTQIIKLSTSQTV